MNRGQGSSIQETARRGHVVSRQLTSLLLETLEKAAGPAKGGDGITDESFGHGQLFYRATCALERLKMEAGRHIIPRHET